MFEGWGGEGWGENGDKYVRWERGIYVYIDRCTRRLHTSRHRLHCSSIPPPRHGYARYAPRFELTLTCCVVFWTALLLGTGEHAKDAQRQRP